MPKRRKAPEQADALKGWQQIAAFLGQPVSVAQRWADSGMPVEKRGRYVYSSREELNRWLGRESAAEPVQIATDETDLSAELKRGLSCTTRIPGERGTFSADGEQYSRDLLDDRRTDKERCLRERSVIQRT